MDEYKIFDNYCDTFYAQVYNTNIIHILDSNRDFLHEVSAVNIFIGSNDKYSETAILAELASNKYIYIGEIIFLFETDSTIVNYFFWIENGVSYAYAIDSNNHYYLLKESVILYNCVKVDNIYKYYYDIRSYKFDDMHKFSNIKLLQNAKNFIIGSDINNLVFNSNPSDKYDELELDDDFGNGMSLTYNDGSIEKLNKSMYCQLISEIGKVISAKILNKTILFHRYYCANY